MYPALVKHENLGTMPYRKIEVKQATPITGILHLPGGQQLITYSRGGFLKVWDMETGTQVKKLEGEFCSIVLSPDGKTLASGSWNGAMKLWSIEKGKVTKTLMGHTDTVPLCWSPDGEQVLGGCTYGTFRVWDVKSGETILGPIKAGGHMLKVRYSPDGKVIAIAGDWRKIWDANTGKLLKTFKGYTQPLGLSAKTCRTVQLWNIETNQPIGTPLHEHTVYSGKLSADGQFLFTKCQDIHVYIWDVSAIIKEAGFSEIVDATPRSAPKIKGPPRIPPGFFDDTLREANVLSRAFIYHKPMGHMTTSLLYHANTPSVAFPPSGIVQSLTEKPSTILNLYPILSTGLET
ncbi:WD40-repeat-containing domain protein [Suillus fuscotomentosus]|uniref:WD40-repeat-containing domain protein n=1 Tax=Suillus fuscotomentosus TaxID=1912939 RepID=A0AAD4DXM1_9AGAM|nr:WD40-repeat-containing domain protein [Suillus fuscotomentosus]KAG1895441.1 WD40-repeat-containing domain protein [Suillus fuscotomentosus]